MADKPKPSKNLAKNVETKNREKVEKLYAQIGRLQIQREQGLTVAQAAITQMQKIYQQIQALEGKK